MIETFQNLPESSLPDLLNNLKSEADLVILRDSIVAIGIIIAIVNNTFGFSWMNFKFILGEIVDFFKFSYFLLFRFG